MSDFERLPFDVARCNGVILQGGSDCQCGSRDKCLRYLNRENIGRGSSFIVPESEDCNRCDKYVERVVIN